MEKSSCNKLTCEGSLNYNVLSACEKSTDEVVVIENPFQPEWHNKVIKLISKRDKMYFLVHPYAEDLIIEPRGLYNYCVPLLTELFVEGKPTKHFVGGKCSEEYKPYASQTNTNSRLYNRLLDELKVHSIFKANIQQLLEDIRSLLQRNGSDEVDDDYRFILYPLAYALEETSVLAGFLNDDENKENNLSKDLRMLLTNLAGE